MLLDHEAGTVIASPIEPEPARLKAKLARFWRSANPQSRRGLEIRNPLGSNPELYKQDRLIAVCLGTLFVFMGFFFYAVALMAREDSPSWFRYLVPAAASLAFGVAGILSARKH